MSGGVLIAITVPSAEYEERLSIGQSPGSAAPLEKIVEDTLKSLYVYNSVWSNCQGGNYKQVWFSVDSGDKCEDILNRLNEWGVGGRLGSSVSVIPCSLYWEDREHIISQSGCCSTVQSKEDLSAWTRLVTSVRARLAVAQVVEGVKADAEFTFDFLVMLIIAGLVSALGLIENSTGILVASMLISPLMGPVMAGTFGIMVKDQQLQKIGIRNEMFGLLLILLEGFVFGIILGLSTDHWGSGDWPTLEMTSRGELHSIWVGIAIALLSGAAVAIAILGDRTSSLVGVAISASLLPPAVNAGLLWGLTVACIIYDTSPSLSTPFVFMDDAVSEFAVMGAMSLGLTFVNIVCIFVSAVAVLKMKAVAPYISRNEEKFWNHDIKLAREYEKTYGGAEATDLANRLASTIGSIPPGYRRQSADLRNWNVSSLNLFHKAEGLKAARLNLINNQSTWSPMSRREEKSSIQDVNRLYASLSPQSCQSTSNKATSPASNPGDAWLPTIAETSGCNPSDSSQISGTSLLFPVKRRFVVTPVHDNPSKDSKPKTTFQF